MFRAPCAHHQEVKIVLYSLWYRHTYRWPSRAQVERLAGFVIPDDCITLVQFYLGVLVLLYLLCLFCMTNFDVLLTVHLSIFILVINQLDAQNFCFTISISCLYMFRALCAHHQEVKTVLYSLWYHHTYRWPSRAHNLFTGRPPIGVMIPEAV